MHFPGGPRRFFAQPHELGAVEVSWAHELLGTCYAVFDGTTLHVRDGRKYSAARVRLGSAGWYSTVASGYIAGLDTNRIALLWRENVPSWPGAYAGRGMAWQFYVDATSNFQLGSTWWGASNEAAILARSNNATFGASFTATFPVTEAIGRFQMDSAWGTARLYRDDVQNATAAPAGTFATDTRKVLSVTDCAWGFAFDDTSGRFSSVYAELQRDPWQVLVRTPRRIFFLPSGASGTTIDGSVGAAAAAGAQAAVVLTTTIAGSVGAANAAGAQAAVVLSTPVATSVGAATAAGAQATIVLSTDIAASVGAADAAGAQATVQTGAAIAVSVGTAAASGATANVVLSTPIAAATGDAVAAGATATVLQTTTVAATVGAATADGATAQVVPSTSIQVSVGDAAAAGATAAIPTATTVPAAVGAATASGAPATIDAGRVTVSASVGAGAAAGATANVAAVTSILASIGAAAAEGAQAAVAEQIIVPGLVGAAAAAGVQATVLAGLRIDVGTAQAAAAGWLADIMGAGFTPKGTLAEAIIVAPDDNAVIVPYEDRTVYVR